MVDKKQEVQQSGNVACTGIAGLNEILRGGLPRSRLFLVKGAPGVGKTTLGLQFLMAGAQRGEACLYVTLSETRLELESMARSHGWSLEGIEIFELSAAEQLTNVDLQQTLFHPADVELSEATRSLVQLIERVRPQRLVFDSLGEVRLLAGDSLRFRRQMLALKQFFSQQEGTVILLDEHAPLQTDHQLESLAHGVILLEQLAPTFGDTRRRLQVTKVRGTQYAGGYHDFVIQRGGLCVFPRLVAREHSAPEAGGILGTGSAEFDDLLGGGLDAGGSMLFMGPAGTGKSTLTALCMVAAAKRGERSITYLFDEGRSLFLRRAQNMGLPVAEYEARGLIQVESIDPAALTPGEFAHRVRSALAENSVKLVVIDSLTGYLSAMSGGNFLLLHLHELLSYLGQRGVTSILVYGQHGLFWSSQPAVIDLSYLADAVVLLRFFEHRGEMRKCISVIKRRGGGHEHTIRELKLGPPAGVTIGDPLRQFQGVLTGLPRLEAAQPEVE